ncbi:MAG TPA: hypothetical protein VGL91_01465, partial [Acidobacteriota bacterium]
NFRLWIVVRIADSRGTADCRFASKLEDPNCEIHNPQSEIRNPQSEDPQSEDPQSEIRNFCGSLSPLPV